MNFAFYVTVTRSVKSAGVVRTSMKPDTVLSYNVNECVYIKKSSVFSTEIMFIFEQTAYLIISPLIVH